MTDKVKNFTDVQIGENIALIRGRTPQGGLAQLMKERGHKWSQNTVWLVEQGERPLRMSEAKDLADIFGIDIKELLEESETRKVERYFRHSEKRLMEATANAHHALAELAKRRVIYLTAFEKTFSGEHMEELDRLRAENLETYERSDLWPILLLVTYGRWQEKYPYPEQGAADEQENWAAAFEEHDFENEVRELFGVDKPAPENAFVNARYEELKCIREYLENGER